MQSSGSATAWDRCGRINPTRPQSDKARLSEVTRCALAASSASAFFICSSSIVTLLILPESYACTTLGIAAIGGGDILAAPFGSSRAT
jgi:hypothetical protein